MGRQRTPTRSVLLSDELSRDLMRAQSLANAGSTGATSPTASEVAAAAPPKKAQKMKLVTAFRRPICKQAESAGCRIGGSTPGARPAAAGRGELLGRRRRADRAHRRLRRVDRRARASPQGRRRRCHELMIRDA